MASTLIKRMVSPESLTDSEAAAITIVTANSLKEDYKLPISPVLAVAQEIIEGRLPSSTMLMYISTAEMVDADIIMSKVSTGEYTLDWLGRLLIMGERDLYNHTVIEAILGL